MSEQRRRPVPSRYHLLSVQEKQAEAMGRAREPAVRCPDCDTQVMPVDLPSHQASRCPGAPEPGPGWKWVNWHESLALGVPPTTLSFWARTGQVRFLGGRMDRKYLLRDLARKIAERRGFRRR